MLIKNLTVFVTVYNEQERIGSLVRRVKLWCDQIIIIDKSSTDDTATRALDAGAQVISAEFSEAGDDNGQLLVDNCLTEWFLWLTPSEQITAGMVIFLDQLLTSLKHSTDVVALPVKLYSFGEHVARDNGPWSVSYQPRLINKMHGRPVNQIHKHWAITSNSVKVPFSEEVHVIHCTHRSFESFIHTHLKYAKVEALHSTNREHRINVAIEDSRKFDFMFDSEGIEGFRHKLAWKIYNYMIILNMITPSKDEIEHRYSQVIDDASNKIIKLSLPQQPFDL